MDWKLNSLIFLCKTLNSAMNIIEMRANANIHSIAVCECIIGCKITKIQCFHRNGNL